MFKAVVQTAVVFVMFAGSVAQAANKAEMNLAVNSTDLESIVSVSLSVDQPAMQGLISVDLLGTVGNEAYTQTIYIYEGANPELQRKFSLNKVQQ